MLKSMAKVRNMKKTSPSLLAHGKAYDDELRGFQKIALIPHLSAGEEKKVDIHYTHIFMPSETLFLQNKK